MPCSPSVDRAAASGDIDFGQARFARNWEAKGECWTAVITTRFFGMPREL
jgi:hypothetical protein